MKNYIIEDIATGRTVASGTASGKLEARTATGFTGRRYVVTEATADGINYQPIAAKKRPGAPKGSRNAAKPDGPVVSQIVFRCPPELKAAAIAKAAPDPLSVWMVETVRRAVGDGCLTGGEVESIRTALQFARMSRPIDAATLELHSSIMAKLAVGKGGAE